MRRSFRVFDQLRLGLWVLTAILAGSTGLFAEVWKASEFHRTPGGGTEIGHVMIGNYLYIGGGNGEIVNVADPENPQHIGSIDTGFGSLECCNLGYSESLNMVAYGGYGNVSFRLYDVSNPVSPVRLCSVSTAGLDPSGFVFIDHYLYIGSYDDIWIYDTSNPQSPALLSLFPDVDHPDLMVLSGHHLYCSTVWEGFHMLDVSSPEHQYRFPHLGYSILVKLEGLPFRKSLNTSTLIILMALRAFLCSI
jgi:hypothetical protein